MKISSPCWKWTRTGVPESCGDAGADHPVWRGSPITLTRVDELSGSLFPSHIWEPAFQILATRAKAWAPGGREAIKWAKLVSAALPYSLPGHPLPPSRRLLSPSAGHRLDS